MKTIKDIDINNKTVLIRCDLNVPIKDGNIEDDNRIVKSLETIKYALKHAKNKFDSSTGAKIPFSFVEVLFNLTWFDIISLFSNVKIVINFKPW